MADISTFIKRQLFRRNETFLLLLLFVALIFIFILNQKVGCDVKNDSLPQKAIKTNEQSIPVELETFLFIMILTAPNGKERRDAMRKTWLSNLETLHSSVVPRFVIGIKELSLEDMKNVEEENSRHHDIIFLPELKDAYKDLPSKVLQALKWIDQHANFSYLLKVDDDSFVRLNVILNELQSTYSMKRLYWGFFRGDAHVKFTGPWAEKNWNLCDRYLPYAQGGGYVLSRDLVNFIARNSDFLQKFNSEDVSVGTWLAPLQVNRVHDYRFDTEYRSRGCNNLHIVSHKQSVSDMYQKHRQLQKDGKLCHQETHLMNSFIYNWSVPPTKCCKRMGGIP
ncbi:beta-1,3-galactosyltransferase 6-like [Pocillopora damicornis]|uniref:beta-1,3-galactosyltransferase 6-like n=1 Tax=Pocillopora damicornis TaxID=46731 RepID=UPI000F554FBB|nr:beta-1,3-galactosyltransferase 6-like [Pocillopora damicornis]